MFLQNNRNNVCETFEEADLDCVVYLLYDVELNRKYSFYFYFISCYSWKYYCKWVAFIASVNTTFYSILENIQMPEESGEITAERVGDRFKKISADNPQGLFFFCFIFLIVSDIS